jgi:two-component system sensor histidine kinase KdpD
VRAPSTVLRALLTVVAVGVFTALLVAADADLTFAAVLLLLVVAGASVTGYAAGLTAAVAGSVALIYFFTPPLHSLRIDQPDDILALVAFVTVSLLVGATIARLNELRTRAEMHAREASLRVTLTDELRRGVDLDLVLRHLESELSRMFDFEECSVSAPTRDEPPPTGHGDVLVDSPPLLLRFRPRTELAPGDLAVIRGLLDAVGTGIKLDRLDAEAREQRVRSELDHSRAALLTAITHDLRTPLATIRAASSALLAPGTRLDADERRELLVDTRSEAERLERLIDNALELGRIRGGVLRPERSPSAPVDLVQSVVSRRARSLHEHPVLLELDADLPVVDVDVTLMDHVLTNLLDNAVRHGGSDHPIEVRGSAAGGVVQLAVVDHGPGVPAADRERIFDEFVQGRSSSGGGTGLGLSIVRALTAAHGGRVWCEASPGGGATFVVELPVSEEERRSR